MNGLLPAQCGGRAKSARFDGVRQGKRFFFEKKAPRPGKQKTFGPGGGDNLVAKPAGPDIFVVCTLE